MTTVPCYRYRAELLRTIDGDTFVMRVDLGFYCAVTVHVRLHGYNAPELRTPEGPAARDAARVAMEGKALVVESYHDARSFERWVADVYVDGVLLADVLRGAA